ncbi:MAG: hypothetical protein ACJZ12_04730 [Candidatus Neomarinimicrobiota bacterium]
MRRYLPLLLFIPLASFSQEKLDKLLLNNKTEYIGKFLKIEGDNILFKETDGLASQSIPIKTIKKLELADGSKSIIDGIYLTSKILEIQELARADAKDYNTVLDWFLIGICGGVTGTCGSVLSMIHIDDTPPIFILGGLLGAALPGIIYKTIKTIYKTIKNKNSKHIHYQYPNLINTEEEKNVYQNSFDNELKRQSKINTLTFCSSSCFSFFAIIAGSLAYLGMDYI